MMLRDEIDRIIEDAVDVDWDGLDMTIDADAPDRIIAAVRKALTSKETFQAVDEAVLDPHYWHESITAALDAITGPQEPPKAEAAGKNLTGQILDMRWAPDADIEGPPTEITTVVDGEVWTFARDEATGRYLRNDVQEPPDGPQERRSGRM